MKNPSPEQLQKFHDEAVARTRSQYESLFPSTRYVEEVVKGCILPLKNPLKIQYLNIYREDMEIKPNKVDLNHQVSGNITFVVKDYGSKKKGNGAKG